MAGAWLQMWDKAERSLVELIQRPVDLSQHPRLLRLFMFFLRQCSYVYGSVVCLRSFLYDKGIFRENTLGCQVISVGNLTVGGTGKTPVVEVFARELQKAGRSVAILSRGYRKKEQSFARKIFSGAAFGKHVSPPRVVSDGSNLLLDWTMSGDEPYMLATNLKDVCVVVDQDRVNGGRHAIRHFNCDTLILDDGFQYRRLKHWVDIVLVDSTNPFGNEFMLPRGILREPVRHIRKADFIFITKCNGNPTAELKARLRSLNAKAEIIECCHKAVELQNIRTSEREGLDFLKGRRVSVVSGIASPEGFETEIKKLGATIVHKHRFADHHAYSAKEVISIINSARRSNCDAIVTTEKDAVRFPNLIRHDVPVFLLRVHIELLSGAEDFRACIERISYTNNPRYPELIESVSPRKAT